MIRYDESRADPPSAEMRMRLIVRVPMARLGLTRAFDFGR
jgi:hypothetical protein